MIFFVKIAILIIYEYVFSKLGRSETERDRSFGKISLLLNFDHIRSKTSSVRRGRLSL